jgi:hypothetical protein
VAQKRVPEFGEDEETVLLAKAIALYAFREPLEGLHARDVPCSMSGDYSDVKVVSPYGEIPWNEVQRIADDEMKYLMAEVVSRLFTVLSDLDDKKFRGALMVLTDEATASWDKPEVQPVLKNSLLQGGESERTVKRIVSVMDACEAERRNKARTGSH